jgi:hypothetical protein
MKNLSSNATNIILKSKVTRDNAHLTYPTLTHANQENNIRAARTRGSNDSPTEFNIMSWKNIFGWTLTVDSSGCKIQSYSRYFHRKYSFPVNN